MKRSFIMVFKPPGRWTEISGNAKAITPKDEIKKSRQKKSHALKNMFQGAGREKCNLEEKFPTPTSTSSGATLKKEKTGKHVWKERNHGQVSLSSANTCVSEAQTQK